MVEERKFLGVWIPKEIWNLKELSLQEKILLQEINYLDNEKGCFATNRYFAEFFMLSQSRVSQIIKELERKEFITATYFYKQNTNEFVKRAIQIKSEKYNMLYTKMSML